MEKKNGAKVVETNKWNRKYLASFKVFVITKRMSALIDITMEPRNKSNYLQSTELIFGTTRVISKNLLIIFKSDVGKVFKTD